jgi:hypothetical protein
MRALFAALALLSACAAPAPPPPHIYPEAELAPGHILAPIRAVMGDQIAFTNARVVSEGVMEVEGARADGAYKFTVTQQGDRWVLTNTERLGPAP